MVDASGLPDGAARGSFPRFLGPVTVVGIAVLLFALVLVFTA